MMTEPRNTATVFLRQPVGVAIHVPAGIDAEDAQAAAAGYLDALTVINDRGHTVIIPTDNIASVELR